MSIPPKNLLIIQSLPTHIRPREKCLKTGSESLTLEECLALVFGTGPKGIGCLGLARRVIETISGPGLNPDEQERAIFSALMAAPKTSSLKNIQQIHLGDAQYAKFEAVLEFAKRFAHHRIAELEAVRSSEKIYFSGTLREQAALKISHEERYATQEWIGFIPIYTGGRLGGFCLVERGVRTHVNTDPQELFVRLLPLRPEGFVLFHNHPSGNLAPSSKDMILTQEVDSLARKLGIRLIGHGIVHAQFTRFTD